MCVDVSQVNLLTFTTQLEDSFPLACILVPKLSEMESIRPRRTNANTHPGQIVNEFKQKRRSTAEKAAAVQEKADREADTTLKAQEDRSAVVGRIAQLEDTLQREDRSYGYKVSGKSAASKGTYREAIANPR